MDVRNDSLGSSRPAGAFDKVPYAERKSIFTLEWSGFLVLPLWNILTCWSPQCLRK